MTDLHMTPEEALAEAQGVDPEDLQALLDDIYDEYFDEEPEPRPVTAADVADLLDATVAWYGDHGWTQGNPFKVEDGVQYACLNGAIFKASGLKMFDPPQDDDLYAEHQWNVERYWRALTAVGLYVGEESHRWNDSIGQTKGRVVDTISRLARDLRTADEAVGS